jgi:hypothetical protein
MAKGEEAKNRLQEMDKNSGMTGKKRRVEGREVGMPPNNQSLSRTNVEVEGNATAAAYLKGALTEGVLSDTDLAAQRLNQAEQLKKQAQTLLAEAAKLAEEAVQFLPAENVKTTRAKKATSAKKQAD